MRMIDADALFRKVKTECNPYGKPTIGFEDGNRVMNWIEQAPTIGGWISVNDRLPERYERILTYDKYSGAKENWLLNSHPCVSWSLGFHVTHWMPMPEKPKETNT